MPTYQSVVIYPNQTVYVPKNAVIVGINSTGDVEIDSSCIDLTAPPFLCYFMAWSVSADETPSVSLEYQATSISGISALGSVYTITGLEAAPLAGPNTVFNTILAANGLSAIISNPVFVRPSAVGNRYPVKLYFKTTAEIAQTIELRIIGPDFDNGLWIKPVAAESGCSDNIEPT